MKNVSRTINEHISIECFSWDDVVSELAKLKDARTIDVNHREIAASDGGFDYWQIEAVRLQ